MKLRLIYETNSIHSKNGSVPNCRERPADCKEAAPEYWGRFLTTFGITINRNSLCATVWNVSVKTEPFDRQIQPAIPVPTVVAFFFLSTNNV